MSASLAEVAPSVVDDALEVTSVSMAPSGDRLAAGLVSLNRSIVRVVEWQGLVEQEVLVADSAHRFDVTWLSDTELLVFVHRLLIGGSEALSSIHVLRVGNGEPPVALDWLERTSADFLQTPPGGRAHLVSALPDDPERFLLAESPAADAPLRLSIITIADGSRRALLQQFSNIHGVLADGHGEVVVLHLRTDQGGDQVRVRSTSNGPWRTLIDDAAPHEIELLAIEPAKQNLLVRARSPNDPWDAYRVDAATGDLIGPIVGNATYDVAGVLQSESGRVLAFLDNSPRPRLVFVDPQYRRLQQGVDLALPGRFNRISSSNFAKRRFVVLSEPLGSPTEVYALDQGRSSLQQVIQHSGTEQTQDVTLRHEIIRNAARKPVAELKAPHATLPPPLVIRIVDAESERSRFDWLGRAMLDERLAVLSVVAPSASSFGEAPSVEQWMSEVIATTKDAVQSDPQLSARQVCIVAEGIGGVLALQVLADHGDWVSCVAVIDAAAAAQYPDFASCADCEPHMARRDVHRRLAEALRSIDVARRASVLWVSDNALPPLTFFGLLPDRLGQTDIMTLPYDGDARPNWRRQPSRDPLSVIRDFVVERLDPARP